MSPKRHRWGPSSAFHFCFHSLCIVVASFWMQSLRREAHRGRSSDVVIACLPEMKNRTHPVGVEWMELSSHKRRQIGAIHFNMHGVESTFPQMEQGDMINQAQIWLNFKEWQLESHWLANKSFYNVRITLQFYTGVMPRPSDDTLQCW